MKFCLDRMEGRFAVCLCEDEDQKKYDFSLDENPALRDLSEGALFEATLDGDGKLQRIVVKQDETKARLAAATARLHALAARTKKNREN